MYRVTKFARQHKLPISRSAFTYCEDDIPSGLDLGKSNHGGPFTTEQVEDVKTLYGMIIILIALGISLFMNITSSLLSSQFFSHVSTFYNFNHYDTVTITYVMLTLLFTSPFTFFISRCVSFAFYILLVRQFIYSYKIKIFGQIAVGIVFLLLTVISTFITDAFAHTRI